MNGMNVQVMFTTDEGGLIVRDLRGKTGTITWAKVAAGGIKKT
jgi:hypothetical protein